MDPRILGSYAFASLALLWVIGRDLPGQGATATAFLLGGVAFLWLPSLVVDVLGPRFRIPAWPALLSCFA